MQTRRHRERRHREQRQRTRRHRVWIFRLCVIRRSSPGTGSRSRPSGVFTPSLDEARRATSSESRRVLDSRLGGEFTLNLERRVGLGGTFSSPTALTSTDIVGPTDPVSSDGEWSVVEVPGALTLQDWGGPAVGRGMG